jgi:hypothetical protein
MEKFFEIIDDCLVNWYFANEKEFEIPFQKVLNKARFDITNKESENSGNVKALHTIEDIFFTYVFTLFKKKEIEFLQYYIMYNSYDKELVKAYQARNELDTSFLDYLKSKIDFFNFRKST